MRIATLLIKYITVLSTLISSVSPIAGSQPYEAEFTQLGIPLEEYYSEGIPARTAWDVEVYDDKLFVASGDYDKNMGPVHIFYYDLMNENWVESGVVSDEQIEQFHIIDDILMAPGADPKQDWNFGNIYLYKDSQWVTYRTIPGGIHQFDMIKFDGKTFVALGVTPGNFPIVASDDGCETFTEIPMYKDGILLDTSLPTDITVTSAMVRCFDFFLCNGTLYAFYYQSINKDYKMMLFRYEDGAFYYHSDLPEQLSYRKFSFELFRNKTEYENKSWFTTGKLYVSQDMLSADEVILEEGVRVADLRVIKDRLYVMTVEKKENGDYTTAIWIKKYFSEKEFKKLYYFTFTSPAQSFTYYEDYFYFGMGEGSYSECNPTNGAVLSIKHPL